MLIQLSPPEAQLSKTKTVQQLTIQIQIRKVLGEQLGFLGHRAILSLRSYIIISSFDNSLNNQANKENLRNTLKKQAS